MRFSFLDILACPASHEPLVLVGAEEKNVPIPSIYTETAKRASPANAAVGPLTSDFLPSSDLGRLIAREAVLAGDAQRNESVVVWNGLLVAPNSGRWYPIVDGIPELLPDSLRDWGRDRDFLATRSAFLPEDLKRALSESTGWIDSTTKSGDSHKSAEMRFTEKVPDINSFLGPGYLSPFNPGAFFHSSELIRGFSCCIPFLRLNPGSYVLDSGSGYSWTTEWFMKMGIHAVGLEISRPYLEVGRHRMGANQPHLVIADAENLPFADGVFNAVLGFDAFHHIPDRKKAMRQYCRVMKSEGMIVLVEPGGAQTELAIALMKDFGTLEIGMELPDVRDYVGGIAECGPPKETFLFPATSNDDRPAIPINEARSREFIGWCLYTIEKNAKFRTGSDLDEGRRMRWMPWRWRSRAGR